MKRNSIREQIMENIAANIGTRLGNIERGTASEMDIDLVNEALGFKSLCLYSSATDESLKAAWDKSHLEYAL